MLYYRTRFMIFKVFFLFMCLSLFQSLNAQVLNLPQFFSPRIQGSSDVAYGENFEMLTTSGGALIPLRTKLGLETNFENIKKLSDLKGAVKVNFNQLMARVNYRKSIFDESSIKTQYDRYSISLTGIEYRKKIRFRFYQGGLNYHHTENSTADGYSFTGMVGWLQIMSLKDVVYYGAVGVYNGRNRLLLPLIGWQHKINSKYSFSVLFPSNAKLTYKVNRKVKLDAMTYVYTLRNQMNFGSGDLRMQFFQLRSGMQLRWKPTKKVNLFTEAGYAYGSKKSVWNAAGDKSVTGLSSQPFARVTLFYSFGKSLFNSGILDIGIE